MRQTHYGLGLLLGWLAALPAGATTQDALVQQRDLYEQAQQMLDAKEPQRYLAMRDQIAAYPLTPYLDYRTFLLQLGEKTPAEVTAFQKQFYELPFSQRIRATYLDRLAADGRWQEINEYQTRVPRGETYLCHYYTAKLETGDKASAYRGAAKLWRSGSSVSDACDELFDAWKKTDGFTDEAILGRMLLTFGAGNGQMISYLAKMLKEPEAGEALKTLYRKPEGAGAYAKKQYVTEFNQQLSQLALKRLARKDIKEAVSQFDLVVKGQKLSDGEARKLKDYLAGRLMTSDDKALVAWRDKAIAASHSDSLKERRIRQAMRSADWTGVEAWILRLSPGKKTSLRWQYWLARAEMENGRHREAKKRLEGMLGQRHYYSVVAAQTLGKAVRFDIEKTHVDMSSLKKHQSTLDRVEELIALDKIATAKSEWDWLLARSNETQKAALAKYAASQRWHHLTVKASIAAGVWDDIYLRFPVAHRWWFDFYGEKYDVQPLTLMSLARQESGMDAEARSPVGARGIMQIMPRTAQYTARKLDIPYDGPSQLYSVQKNIEIGSGYLSSLLDRYDGNRIYAFAAYNAGPYRVDSWREQTDKQLDVFAFIEAIPFNETRGYVQNVLMFESYYRYLTGKQGDFLTNGERNAKY